MSYWYPDTQFLLEVFITNLTALSCSLATFIPPRVHQLSPLASLSLRQPQLSLSVHCALAPSFFSFSSSVCWGASKSGTNSCPNSDGPPLCVSQTPVSSELIFFFLLTIIITFTLLSPWHPEKEVWKMKDKGGIWGEIKRKEGYREHTGEVNRNKCGKSDVEGY